VCAIGSRADFELRHRGWVRVEATESAIVFALLPGLCRISRGTSKIRNRDKTPKFFRCGSNPHVSGAAKDANWPDKRGFQPNATENLSRLRLGGGEGGIRTLGTGYPVRQISNLVPSTTRPPLRGPGTARESRLFNIDRNRASIDPDG